MTLSFNSAMQGIIAGGTTTYLHERGKTERNTRDPKAWTTAALQLNQLLLLSAETLCAAEVPLGSFGTLAKTVFALTPLAFLREVKEDLLSPSEVKFLKQFQSLYQTGIAVNFVVTCALGNPCFTVAAFALTLAASQTSNAKARQVLAICSGIGYGAKIFSAPGFLAALGKVSAVAIGSKLFIYDNPYLNDMIKRCAKKCFQAVDSFLTPPKTPSPSYSSPLYSSPAPSYTYYSPPVVHHHHKTTYQIFDSPTPQRPPRVVSSRPSPTPKPRNEESKLGSSLVRKGLWG